jgi:hypothetical protein
VAVAELTVSSFWGVSPGLGVSCAKSAGARKKAIAIVGIMRVPNFIVASRIVSTGCEAGLSDRFAAVYFFIARAVRMKPVPYGAGTLTVLALIVAEPAPPAAPLNMLPVTAAPVLMVMLVAASTFPWKMEPTAMVAEVSTCQKT